MFETTKELTVNRWMAVAMPDERIFGLYLASALVMALITWLYYRHLARGEKPGNIDKGVLAYIFDREVFSHRSSKQDFWYFLVNGLIYVGLISQLLISTHFFMMMFYGLFGKLIGVQDASYVPPSWWVLAIYTVVYTLFLDFAVYITHLMQHRIPVLWEFHKVHHSAEVLTPLTLYRMHPVDLFLTGIVASMLAGLAFAGFYYLTGETPQAYEVMGINVLIFAFYLLGYNLRHSHIWLAYPAWLSHVLISPAQHQIHHSTAPKHFDKNLGLMFAFWDKMFGTLYVPQGYEKISYGLSVKKPNPFNSVLDFYIQPFQRAWKLLCPEVTFERLALVTGVLGFFVVNYFLFFNLDRTMLAANAPLPTVHIEDLTWTEVQTALDKRDYDTIIIPTGGTEQNGAHVVIGKHNYIVRYTAEKIAERLGGTLVAPVIAFVPENVHMDYAGTLSVPEELFEDLLTATAESYIHHGFKNILFIGDSYGNQEGQANVAAALGAKHKDDGVTVAQIGDYYEANGQYDWLIGQGYTREEIGGHAGIRDTSEMALIHPEGVRRHPWLVEGRPTGHSGNFTFASKRKGEKMVELKVDAAVKQIHEILQDRKRKAAPDPAKMQYKEPK